MLSSFPAEKQKKQVISHATTTLLKKVGHCLSTKIKNVLILLFEGPDYFHTTTI
jgi:hypothetical protein